MIVGESITELCFKIARRKLNLFPNTPFWDRPKFKEAENDNWNVAIKVPIAANEKGIVYKIQVNPIHTIFKYGDYFDFMDR